MHLITLDFETYFAKDFSLKKMPTVLYVRSPQFLVQGVGIKLDDQRTEWITEDIDARLNELPWASSALIGHNLLFDGMVLADHYGIIPKQYRDTRSMANLLLPTGINRKLDTVAKLLGHSGKIQGTLDRVKGIRYPDAELLTELGEYCIQDVEATRFIHDAMWPAVPEEERVLMHMTTRMGAASRVELDTTLLRTEIGEQSAKRDARIAAGDHSDAILRSNDQFAALLQSLVDEPIPMKPNKNGKMIPAFSKTDPGWVQFKAKHAELSPLLEAREAAKSNILVKRPERFLQVAESHPGTLPMALNYWGAHTGRWSGAMGLNVQNLPSARISRLRHCLRAPKGYVIHVSDSAQIELRIQLWFSGQHNLLALLASPDGDIYRRVAASIFNKPLAEVTGHERKIGKAVELGGQYGMGSKKYRAYMAGGPLGLPPVNLTEAEAQTHINTYRATHPATVQMWHRLDDLIHLMQREDCNYTLGPVTLRHERIDLPNGTSLDFTGLRNEEGSWLYGMGKHYHFLWGGSLLENIVQGLARIPIGTAAIIAERELDLEVASTTHDELICIGPETKAEENQKALEEIMRIRPSWAPDLPLDAEGGFDICYSK